MEENDTIAALSTGKGNAALAIIRISGKNTFKILRNWIKPENRFIESAAKEIHIYQFFNKQKIIDEITAIKYASPGSFTGEDMVEIICHGGEIVIDALLSCLLKEGIRLAKKGEFTKRAFLNGKMDLLKAEAIGQIIQTNSRKQYSRALSVYEGGGKRKILEWKEIIKSVLVECESKIEFPEEEDILRGEKKYLNKIKGMYDDIGKEIKNNEKIKRLENGISIPIIGIANAGKSTLFNKIVGFDRAIVHYEEGTTRDAISEEIIIGGERIKIIDTAGLNKANNQIEKMGIQKTWENINGSSMAIWVTPSNKEINEYEKKIVSIVKKKKILGIISKKDLNNGKCKEKTLRKYKIPYITVSLIEEKETEKIHVFIKKHVEKLMNVNEIETGIICTKRQEEVLIRINKKIKSIFKNMDKKGEEIISHELRQILKDIEEFAGETTSDDILNEIFNKFCIGK